MTFNRDFHGPNLGYILELYERFQDDPDLVDAAYPPAFPTLEAISP